MKEAWLEMRTVLHKAVCCKEPAPAAMPAVLQDVVNKMKEVSNAVERNDWEKHAKTCSEGMPIIHFCYHLVVTFLLHIVYC